MDTSKTDPLLPDNQALELVDTLAQVNGSLTNTITFLASRLKEPSPLSTNDSYQLLYALARLSRTLLIAQLEGRRRCKHGK